MAVIQCPHCRGPMEDDGSMPSSVVACPHCHRQFVLPGQTAAPPPLPRVAATAGGHHRFKKQCTVLVVVTAIVAAVSSAAWYGFAASKGKGSTAGRPSAMKSNGGDEQQDRSGLAAPTAEEQRLVKQWWRENEPDPSSVKVIQWEAGEIERDPGWKGTRVIWVKYRHRNRLGTLDVTHAMFRISPQNGFTYCDMSEFRGWYWNWPTLVGR